MPETILVTLIYCKFRKYKLRPLFHLRAFQLILAVELIYLILQIGLFMGHYEIVKLAGVLKSFYLCTYLGLIFKFALYPQAIIGSFWMLFGGLCNRLAIWANDGKMPVFPSLSYITGYVKREGFAQAQEIAQDFHVLGSSETNLKILTDYIDLGYSILSIGDIIIRLFVFIIIYHSVKQINESLMTQ